MTCLVCQVLQKLTREATPDDPPMPAWIAGIAALSYVTGLEDEGVADRTRFCSSHLEYLDAALEPAT